MNGSLRTGSAKDLLDSMGFFAVAQNDKNIKNPRLLDGGFVLIQLYFIYENPSCS